jgi:hypothetical protein
MASTFVIEETKMHPELLRRNGRPFFLCSGHQSELLVRIGVLYPLWENLTSSFWISICSTSGLPLRKETKTSICWSLVGSSLSRCLHHRNQLWWPDYQSISSQHHTQARSHLQFKIHFSAWTKFCKTSYCWIQTFTVDACLLEGIHLRWLSLNDLSFLTEHLQPELSKFPTVDQWAKFDSYFWMHSSHYRGCVAIC